MGITLQRDRSTKLRASIPGKREEMIPGNEGHSLMVILKIVHAKQIIYGCVHQNPFARRQRLLRER